MSAGDAYFSWYFHMFLLLKKFLVQCNLSKPDPNGTKYFVRFGHDPDYSDSTFREDFLYCS